MVSVAITPEMLTVCPSDCDYASIQEAIEMASSGDIIEVGAGAYLENLVIDKSLTLLGEGPDQTIIYGAGGPTVVISSGRVHIEGFTITGGKETEEGRWDGDGISIEGSAAVDIQNIAVKCNDNSGIEVRDYAKVTIQANTISHNGWGLSMGADARATVQDSSIKFNRLSGILLRGSAHADISDAIVSFNWGNGISLWDSAEGSIENNWISYNDGDGILLAAWARADIRDNEITNNEGWGVAAYEWPCHPTDEFFFGTVDGWGNEIPDRWKEDGNGKGDTCGVPWWLKG